MDPQLFQRLCVPHVSVLVVTGAWILSYLGYRLRTVAGHLTEDRRALVLICKGMRSDKPRRFILPFYLGPNAIAHRVYFMSVLEQTGARLTYQLNGRASRGTRELAYYGPSDRCQLLWSSDMTHRYLASCNFGWSGAKLNEMASHYPDTPILLLDDLQHILPTADQCLQIYEALEHHHGAIEPRNPASNKDGLEHTGLQVICADHSLGRMQLRLRPQKPADPLDPLAVEPSINA